ncbi:MAG: helix-turn-helix transcriptional regulator [Acidimicrobiales bacterium]
MTSQFEDLVTKLGESVRALRIDHRLTQVELAKRANVSVGAVKNLETGRGSNTTTLVRVVHVLGHDDWLSALTPSAPVFNPLDLLATPATSSRRGPRRVQHSEQR